MCKIGRKGDKDTLPLDFDTLPHYNNSLGGNLTAVGEALKDYGTKVTSSIGLAISTKQPEIPTILEGTRFLTKFRTNSINFITVFLTSNDFAKYAEGIAGVRSSCWELSRYTDNVQSQGAPKTYPSDWQALVDHGKDAHQILTKFETRVFQMVLDEINEAKGMLMDTFQEAGLGSTTEEVHDNLIEYPSTATLFKALATTIPVSDVKDR